MKLSIIIPTRERDEVFQQTLKAVIEAVRGYEVEITVVNDSKTSSPVIPPGLAQVKLINNTGSGVAAARNAGAKVSSGDVLLFLDDDIIVSRKSMEYVLQLKNEIDSGCINVNWEYSPELQHSLGLTQFGRFLKANRLTSFKGWYDHPTWKDNAIFQSTSVASFHLLISRKNFDKTKGYNEKFPLAGFEDYDFPLQLKAAGLSFFIDSRITVYHNETDRLRLKNWLVGQERRGSTRKVAVNVGYSELKLNYGFPKRIALTFFSMLSKVFVGFLTIIPNLKMFDPLYFKLLATLQAATIYKGYRNR